MQIFKNLELSKFNTENVINMGNMLRDCHYLININLSNFNTQKYEKYVP